jgi:hypothetical protein
METKGSPVSLFQLRLELANRLHSRGGRPALEGATRRVKVPVTDRQWQELDELASSFSESDLGFTPSAGQIASVLLSLSLPLARRETERLRKELATRNASEDRPS